jgi:hypothetical protein
MRDDLCLTENDAHIFVMMVVVREVGDIVHYSAS